MSIQHPTFAGVHPWQPVYKRVKKPSRGLNSSTLPSAVIWGVVRWATLDTRPFSAPIGDWQKTPKVSRRGPAWQSRVSVLLARQFARRPQPHLKQAVDRCSWYGVSYYRRKGVISLQILRIMFSIAQPISNLRPFSGIISVGAVLSDVPSYKSNFRPFSYNSTTNTC